jgi:hypothetical protein
MSVIDPNNFEMAETLQKEAADEQEKSRVNAMDKIKKLMAEKIR